MEPEHTGPHRLWWGWGGGMGGVCPAGTASGTGSSAYARDVRIPVCSEYDDDVTNIEINTGELTWGSL